MRRDGTCTRRLMRAPTAKRVRPEQRTYPHGLDTACVDARGGRDNTGTWLDVLLSERLQRDTTRITASGPGDTCTLQRPARPQDIAQLRSRPSSRLTGRPPALEASTSSRALARCGWRRAPRSRKYSLRSLLATWPRSWGGCSLRGGSSGYTAARAALAGEHTMPGGFGCAGPISDRSPRAEAPRRARSAPKTLARAPPIAPMAGQPERPSARFRPDP